MVHIVLYYNYYCFKVCSFKKLFFGKLFRKIKIKPMIKVQWNAPCQDKFPNLKSNRVDTNKSQVSWNLDLLIFPLWGTEFWCLRYFYFHKCPIFDNFLSLVEDPGNLRVIRDDSFVHLLIFSLNSDIDY